MNDSKNTYDYPAVVKHQIVATEQKNYVEAAKLINFSDANICILQHEYGIFGGKNGIYLLLLISKLTKPLLVTLHTVLKNPSYSEKAIIQAISHKAEKLIVMSERAREFLIESYGITENKIAIIEHGVPDYDVTDRESFKKKLNLEGRKPILTFGLLSRDKGIETVISALPDIVRKHPEVLYVVIGKTHPAVIKASGEEYRNYLMSLVEKNKLSNHVHFINKFASNEELFSYLGAADIYVIPNLNKAQITSGTLAYAVGAGSAVVSTNFWHAQSLLSQGRGRLFHPGDSASLSSILNELLSKPELLENMRANAYAYGRKTRWPEIGEKYANLIIDTVDNWSGNLDVSEPIINPLALPDFDLTYIEKMTDDTGILQHANYTVPNLKEGYCIDDNARALLLCVMSYRQKKIDESLNLMRRYLAFIDYMQNEEGSFRNFLGFDRAYLDQTGSEDSFGRTIWSLGYLLRFAPNDAYFKLAKDIFLKARENFHKLESLRGISFTILGLAHYLHHSPADNELRNLLELLTQKLLNTYETNRDSDWHWFESKLTYANGMIPLALLQSHEILKDKRSLTIALEALKFLGEVTFKKGYFSPVGSDFWFEKGSERAHFAQQPIDAMAMVMVYYQAYYVTGEVQFAESMAIAFRWFLGENELGIPLYDFESHGCCDGLESSGISDNQGAESTIAFHLAHLTVLLANES